MTRRMLVFLALAGLTLTAQDAPQTLRTTTRLVQVDVVAVDRKGNPVRDLAREDFTLLEEGKEQPLRIFSVVTTREAPPSKPPRRGTFSNRLPEQEGTPTGATVVLFDILNTPFSDRAFAREHVLQVLENLQPQDRVALYGLGSELRVLHEFTADAAPLREALRNFGGLESVESRANAEPSKVELTPFEEFMQSVNNVSRQQYLLRRLELTLNALQTIAHHVADLPGRKNLVWVSASFPISIQWFSEAPVQPAAPGGTLQQTIIPDFDPAQPTTPLLQRAMRALNDANVALYPVDARGLTGQTAVPQGGSRGTTHVTAPSMSNTTAGGLPLTATGGLPSTIDPIEVMRNLAEDTGGVAYYNTNDVSRAVRRAIDDTTVSYVLGFYPQLDKWDGRFRRISVKVNRPGVTLRYRRGYLAFSEPVKDEGQRQAALKELVNSPLEARALGLTARFRRPVNQPTRVRLMLNVDPADVLLRAEKGKSVGALDLMLVLRGAQGELLWHEFSTLDMNLSEKSLQAMLAEGLQLDRTLEILPNAAELRVLVRDMNSGSVGSLNIPVAAMLETEARTR